MFRSKAVLCCQELGIAGRRCRYLLGRVPGFISIGRGVCKDVPLLYRQMFSLLVRGVFVGVACCCVKPWMNPASVSSQWVTHAMQTMPRVHLRVHMRGMMREL